MIRVLFSLLSGVACAGNVVGGGLALLQGAYYATGIWPPPLEDPRTLVGSIALCLISGVFSIVLGLTGLRATVLLAQWWELLAWTPPTDEHIRQRAFAYWRRARGDRSAYA